MMLSKGMRIRRARPIGINSFKWFKWHNWGSGYDDFEVEVVWESNSGGFTNSGEEDATITFSGEDDRALAELSEGAVPDWGPLLGSPSTNGRSHSDAYYSTCRCMTTLTCC